MLLPRQRIAKGRQDGIGLRGGSHIGSWSSQAPNASDMRIVEWAAVRIHLGGSTPIIGS